MGFKVVPQITGLVRGEPKEGQKHRANGKAILGEMGTERHSASLTLDPSRSHLNEYAGFRSGFACWDSLEAEADAFRVKVNTKYGVRERKLPPDAVIGWAAIFNPPADMTLGWDAATYSEFFTACMNVTADIIPDVFRPENVRMEALHKDEGYMDDAGEYGWNYHVVGVPKGQNGRYCGNLIDAKRCVELCTQFPKKMRDLGWDLEDLDLTDFARMGFQKDEDGNYLLDENGERIPIDPEYREERKAKRREQGRKTNKYISDKKAKAAALVSEAQAIRDTAKSEAETTKTQLQTAQTKLQTTQTKLQTTQTELQTAQNNLLELNKAYSNTYFAKAELERELGDLTEFRRWKADKDAQEAARTAQDDARTAQDLPDAQDAARRSLEAQTAIAAQADIRLRTEEELLADFNKRMGHTTPTVPAPAPAPVLVEQPNSLIARLRAQRDAEKQAAAEQPAPATWTPDV